MRDLALRKSGGARSECGASAGKVGSSDLVLTSLRALEEAETTEAARVGAGVRVRERNAAERMARLRRGMRSETATEVETAIQGATSAATEARLALERVRAALEALRGAG